MTDTLENPWTDMPDEEWNELTDEQKQAEILECNGPPDPLADRDTNIAKYAYTGEAEETSYTVSDWFNSYGRQIASILKDEDIEHADPNKAAAEACIELADDLEKSVEGLVNFLMRKKGD